MTSAEDRYISGLLNSIDTNTYSTVIESVESLKARLERFVRATLLLAEKTNTRLDALEERVKRESLICNNDIGILVKRIREYDLEIAGIINLKNRMNTLEKRLARQSRRRGLVSPEEFSNVSFL
jgi:hypothetical protein